MRNDAASDVTISVLAGGKSTRMGTDKAFVEFEGRTLLARTLDLARSVSADVRVVGSTEKFAPFASVVTDIFRDRGPLGGIHAALRASQTDLNLILAVDMPFLTRAFLEYLLEQARKAPEALVVIPRFDGGWQPLCAVYRREFAAAAENALSAGRNKIDLLFDTVPVRVIEQGELEKAGFSSSVFRNLNTQQELNSMQAPHLDLQVKLEVTQPTTPATKPYIEFYEVSKAFGEKKVLDGVSFNVMPGETVCILGRSGVGKSVSLQLLMGFLKADSGHVIVAGEDVTDFSEEQMEAIRKKVTMVFQNGALFDSLTVGENVAFPLRETRDLNERQIYEIVDGLLKMVGVQEMRDLLPSDLSTGMKRSVAIARALAARPECILYDEPTTMVDPLMAQLLGDLIKRLKIQLNLTSIVVTHDMRLAQKLADRVVFLHEGRTIFVGTPAEMEKSTVPIVREFLELDEVKLEV
ncbi:MAG: transporter related protein [Candidatus Sulfotelmatobacter sp.]|nr:transporter related protein [Candidatus Sulfotelmatobacter sp.]